MRQWWQVRCTGDKRGGSLGRERDCEEGEKVRKGGRRERQQRRPTVGDVSVLYTVHQQDRGPQRRAQLGRGREGGVRLQVRRPEPPTLRVSCRAVGEELLGGSAGAFAPGTHTFSRARGLPRTLGSYLDGTARSESALLARGHPRTLGRRMEASSWGESPAGRGPAECLRVSSSGRRRARAGASGGGRGASRRVSRAGRRFTEALPGLPVRYPRAGPGQPGERGAHTFQHHPLSRASACNAPHSSPAHFLLTPPSPTCAAPVKKFFPHRAAQTR